MLGEQSLAIVTGKGGVGRSAVTAAMAYRASGRHARVLALSMGDPVGLAAHLGVEDLDAEARQIGPSLWAASVDPVAALDEYLGLHLGGLPSRVAGGVFRALGETVPGIRDVVLMGKCVYEAQREDWDLVLVDALPTGQIESLLGAPHTIAELVDRGPIHRQAAGLHRRLADPTFSGILGVAAPEELALTELDDLDARLGELALPGLLGPLLNGVVDPPPDSEFPSGTAGAIARLVSAIAQRQQDTIDGVSPIATIPRLSGSISPPGIALAIAELLP